MSSRRTTYRAAPASYLVLGGVFGGMFALSVHAMMFTHPSFWKAAATFGGALVAVLVWLARFEIRITDDELAFRSLFRGSRRVRLSSIRKVRLGFDLSSGGGPLQLVVESTERGVPKIVINAKVFSSEATRAVLDVGNRIATAESNGFEHGLVRRAAKGRRSTP